MQKKIQGLLLFLWLVVVLTAYLAIYVYPKITEKLWNM